MLIQVDKADGGIVVVRPSERRPPSSFGGAVDEPKNASVHTKEGDGADVTEAVTLHPGMAAGTRRRTYPVPIRKNWMSWDQGEGSTLTSSWATSSSFHSVMVHGFSKDLMADVNAH